MGDRPSGGQSIERWCSGPSPWAWLCVVLAVLAAIQPILIPRAAAEAVPNRGSRTGFTCPHGASANWSYDPAGRANQLTQPGSTPKTWTAGYDGAGNLQQLLAPNGTSESWGYDQAGRPITTTVVLTGTLFSETATLDAAGQRAAVSDS